MARTIKLPHGKLCVRNTPGKEYPSLIFEDGVVSFIIGTVTNDYIWDMAVKQLEYAEEDDWK